MSDFIQASAIVGIAIGAILANLGIVNEGDTLEIDFGAGHMFSDENDHLIGDWYMLAIIGGILVIATMWAVGRFALSSTKEAKRSIEETPKPEENSLASSPGEPIFKSTPNEETAAMKDSPKGKIMREKTIILIKKTYSPSPKK